MMAMFANGSKRNEQFPQMLPTTFRSIWLSCFRVEDFQKSTNQKQELPEVAMFVNGSGQNEQSQQRTFHRCFLPCFGSFGQAVSEEKNLKNQPIRNKSRLWRPCLLTDWDEMSNILTEDLQQMLPTKFRFIWPNGFRREESKKSTNQKQESPVVAMFVNGSGRNEQSSQRTLYRCFLPSFISFGQAVSEEKLFQKLTNKKQELPMTAMFVNGSKRNEQFPQILLTTFRSIWLSCFRVEDFQKSTNQKQESPVAAMFLNGSGQFTARHTKNRLQFDE